MTIDNNLAQKFDRLTDLPISEETLGAYLEGNLDPTEAAEVEALMQSDPMLDFMEGIDEVAWVDTDILTDPDSSDFDAFIEDEDDSADFDDPHEGNYNADLQLPDADDLHQELPGSDFF